MPTAEELMRGWGEPEAPKSVQPAKASDVIDSWDKEVKPPEPESIGKKLLGVGEAGLSLASGTVGGVAGLAGEALGVAGMKPLRTPMTPEETRAKAQNVVPSGAPTMAPEEIKDKISQAITYQPRTQTGQSIMKYIGDPEAAQADVENTLISKKGVDPDTAKALGYIGRGLNPGTYMKWLSDFGEFLKDKAPEGYRGLADLVYNLGLTQAPKIAGAPSSIAKRVLRGGEGAAEEMRGAMEKFQQAGVTPVPGQVVKGGVLSAAGAGEKASAIQEEQIGKKVEQVAQSISAPIVPGGKLLGSPPKALTPEVAGDTIIRGLSGEKETTSVYPTAGEGQAVTRGKGPSEQKETGLKIGGWKARFKDEEGTRFEKAYSIAGQNTPIKLSRTVEALKSLATPTKGAPATSALTTDPMISSIYKSITSDAGAAKELGLADLRKVRSWVGEQVDAGSIAPKMSKKDARAVYEAMSEDVMAAMKAKGPKAEAAMLDALEFSRRGYERIERHIQPVLDKGVPEQVFAAATSGTKDGASRVRNIMDSLDDSQQRVVKATFFKEMGREGDKWIPQKFFNEYSKVHSDVKNVMFGKENTSLRKDVDTIAKVAGQIKGSGTTWYAIRNYGLQHAAESLAGAGMLAHAGGAFGAAAILGGETLAFVTARRIANPKFMAWLARTSKLPPSDYKAALVNLASRTKTMTPDQAEDVDGYISDVEQMVGERIPRSE